MAGSVGWTDALGEGGASSVKERSSDMLLCF